MRSLLQEHGLEPRRSLGQNFVTDPGTVRRIASLSGVGPGSHVLEIGPGVGSLTLALAETGAEVVALEKDPGMIGVLAEVLERLVEAERPRVVEGDALAMDWPALLSAATEWSLVANLPYNVAVPIVMELLCDAPMITRMWVMVQLEVAERLCASPGGRTIGVPTVKLGWYAQASIVMTVAPEVFTPRPKVRSAVVEISRRGPPSTSVSPEAVFALVEQAYAKRRKMLRASLGGRVTPEAFARAGIAPTWRPERLSVPQWAALAEAAAADRPR